MSDRAAAAESLGAGVLVVIPTYNERANLEPIVGRAARRRARRRTCWSPTTTARTAPASSPTSWPRPTTRCTCCTGRRKEGLGAGYLAGFGWGLEHGYDVLVEMDADGSHQPEQLPAAARPRCDDADLVLGLALGARRHGRQLAARRRHALPRRQHLRPARRSASTCGDATGGYRAFRRTTLEKLDLDDVASQGYCFQVDLAWRAVQPGLPRRRGADHVRRAGAGRVQDEPRDRRARRSGGSPSGAWPDHWPAGCAACAPGGGDAWAVLLVVLFLVVPIVEISVIVQVGQAIGAAPTSCCCSCESALGAWLVRREGGAAWEALRDRAPRPAGCPAASSPTPALVLVGGTLLLTPGFVTDVFGFFLILPLTRPLARRRSAGSWPGGRRGGQPADRRASPAPGPPGAEE